MEQRLYRSDSHNQRLGDALAIGIAIIGALLLNEAITLYMAHLMGNARALGASRNPIAWTVWAKHYWHSPALHPYWVRMLKVEAYGLCGVGFVAALFVALYRKQFASSFADLHGSATFAERKHIERAHLLPSTRRGAIHPPGIYLGRWRRHLLRDSGGGHVLVTAPTRTGKGVGVVIPTLLSWRESVFVNDLKGENWAITAGFRASRGHVCMKFDPANPDGSVKYNPLAEVRINSIHEYGDANTIAHALIYRSGSGSDEGKGDYWHDAAIPLLTGAILHVLHEGSNPTLNGVAWLFSDPDRDLEATFKTLIKSKHRLIASAMREAMNKAPKELSGVVGQMMTALDLYRDPIVANNTSCSEFRIDDLRNFEKPASLYLIVQFRDQERLKPLVRILIQQIVHHYTGAMTYQDGRAVIPHKHSMLMMLDEFPTLGHFKLLEKTLAMIAGYGIRMCVIAQSVLQIEETYGPKQSITANCATQVNFTPNDITTAKAISALLGDTTVRRSQQSRSSNGYITNSEPETSRALMDPHEVLTLDPDYALINTHGNPTIHARKIRHYQIAFLDKRSKIPPPVASHYIRRATLTPKGKPPPAPPTTTIEQLNLV